VAPERIAGFFSRFAERHGGATRTEYTATTLIVTAADGSTATVEVPFGPLDKPGEQDGLFVQPLIDHLLAPRRIGLVLARLGGQSVGIAEAGKVIVSRTDRRHVQGRSAAGGWSQQRFARRRAGQARQALAAAADDVAEVLLPRVAELDAVVLGGDRRALDALRADSQLAPVLALAQPRVLELGEPRRSLLDEAAQRALAVEVVLRDKE